MASGDGRCRTYEVLVVISAPIILLFRAQCLIPVGATQLQGKDHLQQEGGGNQHKDYNGGYGSDFTSVGLEILFCSNHMMVILRSEFPGGGGSLQE